MSPESAMAQYEAALAYRQMIIGVRLDSDKLNHPPSLFYALFKRAREDGFHFTSHCDFNQNNTHEHIRQVTNNLGGSGAGCIDHETNASDCSELMNMIKEKDISMTIRSCAYIRHAAKGDVFSRIRKMFDAGIKITIASDDPAYMEDNWVIHNLYLVREKFKFIDSEIMQLQRNDLSILGAQHGIKDATLAELTDFETPQSS